MKKRIFGRMIKKLKWLVIISVVLVALGTVGIGIASVYHMKYALKSLFNMEFNTGSDFWAYGDISSYNKIGERAVAIARSRLNWSYSQAKRTLEGSWDCSSMVARCYQEAGFDLKAIMGAQWCMTTVGWKDFAMKNKQFIEENTKETLAQVFTDVRYTKANNEYFSDVLLKVLKGQGFL